MIRRSAYTSLLLTLAATAAVGTALGGRAGLVLSLACAAIVVLAAGLAWLSAAWRAGAGRVRWGLVTAAALFCVALIVCDILRLLPDGE